MESRSALSSVLAVVALASVACGSSASSSVSGATSPTASPAATGMTIAVATDPKFGQILVDSKGITVYLFVADTSTSSTCYTSCASIWPPVLTSGAPQAGTGADASKLGTTTRTDGKIEVTYAGHPLYYFFKDVAPGDAKGQAVNGFGALWWVMSPAGVSITTKP